jgi:serine/threonine protein kinase
VYHITTHGQRGVVRVLKASAVRARTMTNDFRAQLSLPKASCTAGYSRISCTSKRMESNTNLWSFFTGTKNTANAQDNSLWQISAGILNSILASGIRHYGDLTIGNLLGQGTSFTVHSCIRNAPYCHGTAVAIKRPRVHKGGNSWDTAKSIYTELLLMSHSPLHEDAPIVQVMGYRWFPFEPYPSVLVEKAHFGTLDDYLHLRDGFTGGEWEDCHRLCLSVARALTSVHAEGIIHGDVKPQNILVCLPEGPNDPDAVMTARLTDFSHSTFTIGGVNSHVQIGTPLFSAPESLAAFYDTASKTQLTEEDLPKGDVWSFGLVVWCIITCQASFFQDDWLLPPYDDPPQRVQFLRSQPADFLQAKACAALDDTQTFVSLPAHMYQIFAKVLRGCLEGMSDRRFTMQESSRILDFERYS